MAAAGLRRAEGPGRVAAAAASASNHLQVPACCSPCPRLHIGPLPWQSSLTKAALPVARAGASPWRGAAGWPSFTPAAVSGLLGSAGSQVGALCPELGDRAMAGGAHKPSAATRAPGTEHTCRAGGLALWGDIQRARGSLGARIARALLLAVLLRFFSWQGAAKEVYRWCAGGAKPCQYAARCCVERADVHSH